VILSPDGPADERLFRTEAIPRFYDAGAKDDDIVVAGVVGGYRLRPSHSAGIKELRNLLERVLT
jgi:hypothetical protein